MTSTETAQEFVNKRFAALIVETRQGNFLPNAYSGLLVELDCHWFWVTASHCARKISAEIAEHPHAALAFVTLADQNQTRRVEFARASWSFVDVQRSAVAFVENNPNLNVTDQQARFFDIALMPVPNITQCYLQNCGAIAFRDQEVFVGEKDLVDQLSTGENAIFAAGIPDITRVLDEENHALALELKLFPLHPSPDDGANCEHPRKAFIEDGLLWLPTSWQAESWNEGVFGISGGPVLVISGERVILGGLVAFQSPSAGNPEYLGVTSLTGTLESVRNIIQEGLQEA